MKLTRDQLYQYAYNAGFKGEAADDIVGIAFAESSGNTDHVNINRDAHEWSGTKVPAGTKDRGILQINDWWNPSVTDQCAFDPVCSFSWAFKVSEGGQKDKLRAYWVTFRNGMAEKHTTKGYSVVPTNIDSISATGAEAEKAAQPVTGVGFIDDTITQAQSLNNSMQSIASTVGSLSTGIEEVKKAGPSVGIRVGIFIVVVIILAVGLFLVANSEKQHE